MELKKMLRVIAARFELSYPWKVMVLCDGELREAAEVRQYAGAKMCVVVAEDEGIGITPEDERELMRTGELSEEEL